MLFLITFKNKWFKSVPSGNLRFLISGDFNKGLDIFHILKFSFLGIFILGILKFSKSENYSDLIFSRLGSRILRHGRIFLSSKNFPGTLSFMIHDSELLSIFRLTIITMYKISENAPVSFIFELIV